MSFSVIVQENTAAPAKGVPTNTGRLHIVGKVGGGDTASANLVHNMDEFIGAYTNRSSTLSVPLFDAVDAHFAEGGGEVNVGAYGSSGTYTDGLALLDDRRQGPGQLSIIGTPFAGGVATAVLPFLARNNRVGLFDVGSSDTVGSITTLAASLPANTDLAALFGSWVVIPSPDGVIGSGQRTVPASSVIAALCNRVDQDGNPNRAPGGRGYPLQYVQDFVLDPSDMDRNTLLGLGVNMCTNDFGLLINAGFQTNIPSSAYATTPFWQLNCARARMWLKAQIQAVAAGYFMRPIDGQGKLAAQLKADLDGVCRELYDVDGLYGDTPGDAYKNTVSPTLDSVAQGTLTVKTEARFSLYAKSIVVDLISIPVTGSV